MQILTKYALFCLAPHFIWAATLRGEGVLWLWVGRFRQVPQGLLSPYLGHTALCLEAFCLPFMSPYNLLPLN